MTGRQGAVKDAVWPRRSDLALGALPTAVACARLHARQVMWEWGLAELSDAVEQVVSELVTNGVTAAVACSNAPRLFALPFVRLRLSADQQHALVEVWDSSPSLPVLADVDLDSESGRGLLLVEAISARWGYYYVTCEVTPTEPRDPAGKIVWALVGEPS